MMQKAAGWFLICMAFSLAGKGQQHLPDTLGLNEVEIIAPRFAAFATGQKIMSVDSLSLYASGSRNLADLLSAESPVFIKNFGPGSLSTPSFRGSGAEHTAVLWNGFNLQSSWNAQLDFSLLPVSAADEVSIYYGGNGALSGSGAVGGAVHLNSKPKYNSGIHAEAGLMAGSFNTFRESATVSYGAKKWSTVLRVFNHDAENNFPYRNSSLLNNPEATQKNASVHQQMVLNEHFFKLTANQELNFHFWFQQTDREIPPTQSVPLNSATQEDRSIRATAEWKWNRRRAGWYVRHGVFKEFLNYTDTLKSDYSRNSALTHISEAEFRSRHFSFMELNIGLNNTYNEATSNGYRGNPSMNRFAQFISVKSFTADKKITGSASIRSEFLDGKLLPLMPSFGFEWSLAKSVRLYGNVCRSYRIPTFNDRYWTPGGNPDLKPETSLSEELSVQHVRSKGAFYTDLTATVFNRNTDHWIIWLPFGNYWSPMNLRKVWSRGAELTAKAGVIKKDWQVSVQAGISFVRSTNEASLNPADGSTGNQLIYMPRVTQQYQARLVYKKAWLVLQHTYTGSRFTSTDNLDALQDFHLSNLKAGYNIKFFRTSILLSAEVNNILDTRYQVIADRPMPGRNFLAGITFKI